VTPARAGCRDAHWPLWCPRADRGLPRHRRMTTLRCAVGSLAPGNGQAARRWRLRVRPSLPLLGDTAGLRLGADVCYLQRPIGSRKRRIDRNRCMALSTRPIPGHVQRNRKQPRSQALLSPPRGGIGLQGMIGAYERILSYLLGIFAAPGIAQRETVDPFLKRQHERLERLVEIGRYRLLEFEIRHASGSQCLLQSNPVSPCPHLLEHRRFRISCIREHRFRQQSGRRPGSNRVPATDRQ